MRTRYTISRPTGVSQVTLGRVFAESFRIVGVSAIITPGAATALGPQASLTIQDGAGNILFYFPSGFMTQGFVLNMSWSAASADAEMTIALSGTSISGSIYKVSIDQDLWIQPTWVAYLQIAPNDATDSIAGTTWTIETFGPAAKKGRKDLRPRHVEAEISGP